MQNPHTCVSYNMYMLTDVRVLFVGGGAVTQCTERPPVTVFSKGTTDYKTEIGTVRRGAVRCGTVQYGLGGTIHFRNCSAPSLAHA